MTKPEIKTLSLGANLPSRYGLPHATLEKALDRLVANGVHLLAVSRWAKTPAWPEGSGPDYVNAAAMVESAHDPRDFLALLLELEAELGRVRTKQWGARVCDLDFLTCGERVAPNVEEWRAAAQLSGDEIAAGRQPDLVLPHPRLHHRAFALLPLRDIAPDWRHPVLKVTVAELCDALPETEKAAVRWISPDRP